MELSLNRRLKKYKQSIYSGLFLICIVVATILIKYSSDKRDEKLKANWKISVCTINDVRYPIKSASTINYSYYINKMLFKGYYSIGSRINKTKYSSTKGKQWTIAFDTTDYTNSALLLKLEDYIKFGIPYSGQEVLDAD